MEGPKKKKVKWDKAGKLTGAVLLLALVVFLLCRPDMLEKLIPTLQELNGPAGPVSGAAAAEETADSMETAAQPDGQELLVYFLDVGQGDSELVRVPEEEQQDGYFDLLIDTGEYSYADGLTEYLRDLGVERIDALVCTHPHTDHMGCMARIVQRFEIGRMYMPKVSDNAVPTTAAYEALLRALEEKGLEITALDQATAPDLPERLQVRVLSPRVGAGWENLNNWSAVLRLQWGEVSFLLPGDAEIDVLDFVREDAGAYGWELESTVLKCSHHGSNDGNPSKWLKAVAPQIAVIGCGKDNDYGHPHDGTLERLGKLGVKVCRTDRDGTILLRSDGKTVACETGLPSVGRKK